MVRSTAYPPRRRAACAIYNGWRMSLPASIQLPDEPRNFTQLRVLNLHRAGPQPVTHPPEPGTGKRARVLEVTVPVLTLGREREKVLEGWAVRSISCSPANSAAGACRFRREFSPSGDRCALPSVATATRFLQTPRPFLAAWMRTCRPRDGAAARRCDPRPHTVSDAGITVSNHDNPRATSARKHHDQKHPHRVDCRAYRRG
jgi:hypothetical protein